MRIRQNTARALAAIKMMRKPQQTNAAEYLVRTNASARRVIPQAPAIRKPASAITLKPTVQARMPATRSPERAVIYAMA